MLSDLPYPCEFCLFSMVLAPHSYAPRFFPAWIELATLLAVEQARTDLPDFIPRS